jgi:hypothetical protein
MPEIDDGRKTLRVKVVDFGGSLNYAVPVILQRAGKLDHYYTGAYAGKGILKYLLSTCPYILHFQSMRRLARRVSELQPDKVTAFTLIGLLDGAKRYRAKRRLGKRCLRTARIFGHQVAESINNKSADIIYGLPLGCEEVFLKSKSLGMNCVLEQNSVPMRLEKQIMEEEHALWPGWEDNQYECEPIGRILARAEREYELSDLVLCPSDHVYQHMQNLELSARIELVPYAVDVAKYSLPQREKRKGPLRVIFVGGIRLQKGFQYILHAARQFKSQIEVHLIGKIWCDETLLRRELPSNVELVGSVPHSEILKHYYWADVFCLPSLAEGSARVTYEALVAGLPVICTSNSGSVVRDGIDGYIVPIRDGDAIADKLLTFIDDRKLLEMMSRNCRKHGMEYSWESYGHRLIDALRILENEHYEGMTRRDSLAKEERAE